MTSVDGASGLPPVFNPRVGTGRLPPAGCKDGLQVRPAGWCRRSRCHCSHSMALLRTLYSESCSALGFVITAPPSWVFIGAMWGQRMKQLLVANGVAVVGQTMHFHHAASRFVQTSCQSFGHGNRTVPFPLSSSRDIHGGFKTGQVVHCTTPSPRAFNFLCRERCL